MDRLAPVDIAIVGGGWTGLLMAKEIATRTPLSVVVLERGGPARSLAEYASGMDEVDYKFRLRMLQSISEATVTHRHSQREHAVPIRQYGSFRPGTGVGGAGEHWGAVASRFLPDVFELGTHLRERYGSANLPENLAVKDWGITYDELEPDYWRAEQMMGVCGKAGNIRGKLIEGGNIFEGPRSYEYPNPPHPPTYLLTLFRDAAIDLGYHPYPQSTATLSRAYRNPDGIVRSACQYCGYCSLCGCMVGAKAQPSTTLLPVLQNKKNFHLRTGCWVRQVTHRDGNAEGVRYIDASGKEKLQPASTVVLASWSLNNVRLLLLSSIGDPYDPALGNGTLGMNFTHEAQTQTELFLDTPLNAFMGAGGLGMSIADFAGDPPDAAVSAGVLRGANVQVSQGGRGPVSSFGDSPPGEVTSNWGAEWKRASLKWHDKNAVFHSGMMHFPYRQNYLDLDPTYTDNFGDPLLRLTLDWNEHERRQAAMMEKIQVSLGKAMGASLGEPNRKVLGRYRASLYQSTHVTGGAIMGDSPERSVVNPWLQHWRMPNLWVVGGSAFPQNEGPPTLTILAVTYRAADALIDRYIKQPRALA